MTWSMRRAKGSIPFFALATSEDPSVVNIQGSQIDPGATAFVLMLDPHRRTGATGAGRMFASSCLDAGLLIRGDDELIVPQRFILPMALVQIKDAPAFAGKVRIAG